MRRGATILAIAAGSALLVRTTSRNPTWLDTFTVLSTLAEEHPESWFSQRTRATGLTRVGAFEEAAGAYESALEIAPDHYQLLVDAAVFFEARGRAERADDLLARAMVLLPAHPAAYRRHAEHLLLRGDGRGAHRVALQGLARAGSDRELWALVSESYVAKADLGAATRARAASIAAEPTAVGWARLGDLLDAMDRPLQAAEARSQATRLTSGTEGSR